MFHFHMLPPVVMMEEEGEVGKEEVLICASYLASSFLLEKDTKQTDEQKL